MLPRNRKSIDEDLKKEKEVIQVNKPTEKETLVDLWKNIFSSVCGNQFSYFGRTFRKLKKIDSTGLF